MRRSSLSNDQFERKAQKLQKDLEKKAQKKKEPLEPVRPLSSTSRQICQSWWGKAWCDNIERYSDYEGRLPRGKRYVRYGAVLDLKIEKGLVKAKVMGQNSRVYKVTIEIDPLDEKRKEEIVKLCENKIESLDQLMNGAFPESLKTLFSQKNGLFPSPQEIHLNCSCPDWAVMCKHVAAVMYGIGIKLDENPLLFFTLRNIDPEPLIQKVIDNKLEAMLQNANKKSERILSQDAYELFGL